MSLPTTAVEDRPSGGGSRCGPAGQRGSVTLVVAAAIGLAGVLAALSVDLTRAAAARSRAQTAADAAALAAAQELLAPGADHPEEVARDYARRHGATLVGCECPPAGTEVVVEVEIPVALPFLGDARAAAAAARAVIAAPAGTDGLRGWFASRVACLFEAVPGLHIVSGFRTRAEQARLYREKPHLAAPPGHSKHELGLAADLSFPSDAARAAAHRRAAGCGLAFPVPGEPWHVEPAA